MRADTERINQDLIDSKIEHITSVLTQIQKQVDEIHNKADSAALVLVELQTEKRAILKQIKQYFETQRVAGKEIQNLEVRLESFISANKTTRRIIYAAFVLAIAFATGLATLLQALL